MGEEQSNEGGNGDELFNTEPRHQRRAKDGGDDGNDVDRIAQRAGKPFPEQWCQHDQMVSGKPRR
ncbi:hypothetical protein A9D60_23780 [Leisingera sp. JC1]|nr:hypothetical protein A9D60_23780 [Leisingera sp. JC1]